MAMFRMMILLFLSFGSYPLMAQQTFFGFRTGVGFYSMKSLDQLQEIRLEASGFPLETTESYPATLNYHVEAGAYLPSFLSKWAICYGYGSTGARSTISDYSGRYDLDAVIHNHHLGLTLEKDFAVADHWAYGTYIEAGSIYTRLKTKDLFHLTYPVGIYYTSDYDFIAFGGYGEFGMILHYQYKFLMARLNLGYFMDFQAGFHLKDNKEMQLYLGNNKLRPQWDGLRMGLQLNILLRKSARPV